MTNHTDCDHPKTSGARAKCRRARATGKEVDFSSTPRRRVPKEPEPYGAFNSRTPRDKDRECTVCHCERITVRGTDYKTGLLLYTCDRCAWRIKGADDFQAAE